MAKMTVAWILAAAALLWLADRRPSGADVSTAPHGALAAAAAGQAPKADPVARVNGQPISRERLTDLLIEAHGRQMLQLVVALEAVRQQAQERKMTITPADIAAEEVASFPEELKNLPPAERQDVLEQYLERNNLTRTHWRLAMERQAYIRKLAAAMMPKPTEEDLRELFGRTYGEKVEVLHVQVDSAADLKTVKDRLDKGEDFGKVAREMSTNEGTRKNDGRLNPFDIRDEAVPEEIRLAAFALGQPGRRTEVQYRDHYHLIQLVRRVPPQDVRFEDVRDELAKRLGEGVLRAQMNYLLRAVPLAAEIEILDAVIRKQVEADQSGLSAPTAPTLPGRGG